MYGHVITKFSRMGRLLHFLTHDAPLAGFARESSAMTKGKGLVVTILIGNLTSTPQGLDIAYQFLFQACIL